MRLLGPLVGVGVTLMLVAAACADEPEEEPADLQDEGAPAQTPITILDTLDPTECNFVHSINACFASGQPPADLPMEDYFQLFMTAHSDLVERFGLSPGAVKLAEIGRAEWGDTSLGNPEPGMAYAQVITPGFTMVLESGERRYEYHTSTDRVVFVERQP